MAALEGGAGRGAGRRGQGRRLEEKTEKEEEEKTVASTPYPISCGQAPGVSYPNPM